MNSTTETGNDASEAVSLSTATHRSGRRFASGCIRLQAFAIFACVVTSSCAVYPSSLSPVPQDTRAAVHQLSREIIENSQAYGFDEHLADEIGPRLAGSANYTFAAGWALQQFRQLGLVQVSGEDWLLPSTWEPVAGAGGQILKPVSHELHIHAQGWSPSTPAGGIEGAVVHVKSMSVADLEQQKSELVGAIALVDEDSLRNTGGFEKSLAADQRLQTLGVKGILVPGGVNGIEDLGVMVPFGMIGPVPEAEIGREDVLLIRRLQAHGPVSARFSFTNNTRNNVQVPNVIAEISGRELPDEVVIVNAHLDSWQPGTGAQDDGTGVAMLLETARAIMQLHRAPRRTIRFVLSGGEEEGDLGSIAYVRRHAAELSKIDAVIVVDSGSEPAVGWAVMGRNDEVGSVDDLKPVLRELGATGVTTNTDYIFNTDAAPFIVKGVPSLVLWTGLDKYNLLHHKASDTFDSVVKKDLDKDAAVVASTVYAIADNEKPFAAHLSDQQVADMLKGNGHLEEYEYLKAHALLP